MCCGVVVLVFLLLSLCVGVLLCVIVSLFCWFVLFVRCVLFGCGVVLLFCWRTCSCIVVYLFVRVFVLVCLFVNVFKCVACYCLFAFVCSLA